MLWSEEALRENLRNRGGKRVFYLRRGDQLTSAARDYTLRERIEVLPAEQAKEAGYRDVNGGVLDQKPEHMTHLNGDVLVLKTHPRILFRGKLDTLESELILSQLEVPELKQELEEVLTLTREILRREVLEEPMEVKSLWGLPEEELRKRSHFPQDYYGQPHFMPSAADGKAMARLNRARCAAREAELAGVEAFLDREGRLTRPDIIQALNRLSSGIYLLMIQKKIKQ